TAPADERVTLFSASWKDRLASDAVPGLRAIDRRIPVRVLNYAWHRLGWPRAERVARETFDVIHAAHPLMIPTAGAARVITIHDLHFLDHPERTRAEVRRDYPALAPRHALEADQVVVSSRTTAHDVEHRLGVPAARISLCYPGRPSWDRRAQEPVEGCLAFLGTIEPRKNLGLLLDAYERLLVQRPATPPLVLAGRASAAGQEIVQRCKRPPLKGRVEVPGYLTAAQREALYRRALVFAMPSHSEGFGMPALEAMTVGVPVVAANRGALPEVLGGAGVLVEPDDVIGLADAMGTLLDNASLRQQKRELGWARAEAFDWQTTAHAVRGAWTAAANRRRGLHG
ncbi:MAG TPA: glycosyltransferase family 1 protein, partial [Planctomycetota bacterium]|nr:glycosyltransferase family 1 protein [Planctomycetota bacterium]